MKKVLFVDDSGYARMIMKRILTRAGYEAHEARDGSEALKKLDEIQPDAVIADLLMAGMSGQELLCHIRSSHPRLPVAIVTADIQDSTREECLKLGANLILGKNALFPDGAGFLAEFARLLPVEEAP